jgi:hypothetical protein
VAHLKLKYFLSTAHLSVNFSRSEKHLYKAYWRNVCLKEGTGHAALKTYLHLYPTNAQKWSKGMPQFILNLGIRQRWVIKFMLQLICPQGKSSLHYPLNSRLDSPQNSARCLQEVKNFLTLLRIKPRLIQAIALSLYQLTHSGFYTTKTPFVIHLDY